MRGWNWLKLTAMTGVMLVSLMAATAMPVAAGPPLHQASGGGAVAWQSGVVTYGFTARQLDAEGNASGRVHVIVRDAAPVSGLLEIDVLYLAANPDTGDIWIGGVITKVEPETWVGREIVWRLRDGGQGRKASGPDLVSSIYVGTPAVRALDMPNLRFSPEWTNGNVTLR